MCNNERPLSSKAISYLSDAKWPQLEWLCLTNNGFNQTSVLMELSKANWPLLKTLQVSNMLHAATTSCIALKSLLQSDFTLSSQYTCPGFCQSSSLLRSPIVTPCCSKLYDFRQASGIFIDCLSDSTQPVCLSCLLQRQNVKQLHTTCCPEDDHNHDAWLYLCYSDHRPQSSDPLGIAVQIGLNNFGPEAASQLVPAHWPLLESLTVNFKFVDDVAIKSLIKERGLC